MNHPRHHPTFITTITNHNGIIQLFLKVTSQTFLVQTFDWLIVTETAAVLGQQKQQLLGSTELAAFSLAIITGNLLCLTVILGVLSASDTLSPRAFGSGNYPEVGRLAVRGYLLCFIALTPSIVVILFGFVDVFLLATGQDPDIVNLTGQWLRIYVLSFPCILLLRVIQRFLACQGIVLPLARANFVCSAILHPLILRWFVHGNEYGFLGSAIACVVTRMLQVLLLILQLCVERHPYSYHPETWAGTATLVGDGSFLKEVMYFPAVLQYVGLSFGGILTFSEWWFWEAVCFIVGTLGKIPLSIHSVAYQLTFITNAFPCAASTGLSVSLGQLLSSRNNNTDKDAKRLASACFIFICILGIMTSSLVYYFRRGIIQLFTNDTQVIEGCLEIWFPYCLFVATLYIYGVNLGILAALGMQFSAGCTVVIVLWLGAFSYSYQSIVIHGRDGNTSSDDNDYNETQQLLTLLWWDIPIAYLILNVVLCLQYACRSDWIMQIRGRNVACSSNSKRFEYEEIKDVLNVGEES
eukprot:CAMPEP_0196815912 /NCGR_PEP_ID=MMETSP1362-20130617/52583_1 /TAXON_ID=163516 /ORGANISM="Leptocylindrus danicus, Strain CCMP1856" /LENGTH=523 /DNA_ID=CAMNT_0042193055 /DNA_START=207 /DNA_END=1774 /DNA_ORIENTATION=+